jgi:hypothetical protein
MFDCALAPLSCVTQFRLREFLWIRAERFRFADKRTTGSDRIHSDLECCVEGPLSQMWNNDGSPARYGTVCKGG